MIARKTAIVLLVVFAGATVHSEERIVAQVAELAREVRDKGWIIYGGRTKNGDWDLFKMRPDGSDARNLTNTPEFNEGLPRFSPDGGARVLWRSNLGPFPERHAVARLGCLGRLCLVGAGHEHASVQPVSLFSILTKRYFRLMNPELFLCKNRARSRSAQG